MTALHEAALQGSSKVCGLLVRKGAEVNIKDGEGKTPLHYAKDRQTAEVLIDAGGDINITDNRGRTPLHTVENVEAVTLLIDRGAEINATSNYGHTPLHIAAKNGFVKIAELLISNGANINVRDQSEQTPLELTRDKTMGGQGTLVIRKRETIGRLLVRQGAK